MNIPAFTAEASLSKAIGLYSSSGAFGQTQSAIYLQQLGKPEPGVNPKCFYECYQQCMKACKRSPHGGD